jgi:hypothetical protein
METPQDNPVMGFDWFVALLERRKSGRRFRPITCDLSMRRILDSRLLGAAREIVARRPVADRVHSSTRP